MPKLVAAALPGTKSLVLEIDPSVLKVGREQLGLHTSAALKVRIGDARIGIRTLPANSEDLVVGDAFASLSVPWHLTTREFAREIGRVMRPNGVYIVNIIDYPSFRFVRSELATLETQFKFVAAVGPALNGYSGGNVVLVASNRVLFGDGFQSELVGETVFDGLALKTFVGTSPVIRDDFAPIDQWLNADKH